MDEYRVRDIIKKDRDERGPGLFGAIFIFTIFGIIAYVFYVAGQDYKALKENVKTLQEEVQKLQRK